ncbi:kinesin-like protein CG14535 isoform X2 [Daktulosphaira vitifoliae]|uniref:kinesin-like protein CG14535 isoform X2 n=1 Tax=Daktulosphaira vitifoliae TaxID=58002 RepID=UPI0021AACA60|nr:kinesin-like protein CG14535 isoform X2 [Daktulosphaira vitifoliae]
MTTTVEVTTYRRPFGHGDMASIMGGRSKQKSIPKLTRKATPIPVLPPRIPTPMPKKQIEEVPKLKIAKYQKTYKSSLAAHLKLQRFDEYQSKEKQNKLKQQQHQPQSPGGRPQPPLPPTQPAASYSTSSPLCTAGGEIRNRGGHTSTMVTGGGGSRVQDPQPTPARRRIPRIVDSHVLIDVIDRKSSSLTLSAPLQSTDVAKASVTGGVRSYLTDMYAATDARYGLRYGLQTANIAVQDTKTSTAAAFFLRASQKLNLNGSPHRRKRRGSQGEESGSSTNGFASGLHKHAPPLPALLQRRIAGKELTGVGKVKVILRVAKGQADESVEDQDKQSNFMSVDQKHRQLTLIDPNAPTPSNDGSRRVGVIAPKMFAFDALFTPEDTQVDVCSAALMDVIHAVIHGTDGSVFCYGQQNLGKSYTMIGSPDDPQTYGVIPCAISWLFKGIQEQKTRTGTRFSVRVSAVEVSGPATPIKDLLAGQSNDGEDNLPGPGAYLRGEDPVLGTPVQYHSELRAQTIEKAAYYLDVALKMRNSSPESHMLYTLHVYQYTVPTGSSAVAGGRSRLHLLDLGSCERSKSSGGLTLSGLGNVLLAIFNGQKHLPHREQKLTQLLKECLNSLTCHAAMIAHVSSFAQQYTETLSAVQLASRIHRMRRRRFKFVGVSSGCGTSTGDTDNKVQNGMGPNEIEPSSSEQSADTVIYVGPSEETDGEHPPVHIPSLSAIDNRCHPLNKLLREPGQSRSTPSSPQRIITSKTAPATKAAAKPNGVSSARSSPVRNPKSSSNSKRERPEERWIDGPKISKSRVHDTRAMLMSKKKDETWIDGPMHGGSVTQHSSVYGFMDYHKKNMIKKWVENQVYQVTDKHNKHREMKEYTALKTDDLGPRGRASGQEENGEDDSKIDRLPVATRSMALENHQISRVPIERLRGSNIEEYNEEDDEIELEIVEVEELEEPVPTQDSCLQVTEEDIAFCMGELENPLPEVDQEEHPLRILSQENMTVVSTFTDSLSVANDIDRVFSRPNTNSFRQFNHRLQSVPQNEQKSSRDQYRYEQLSRLHELYNGKVGVPKHVPNNSNHSTLPSRLQSASLSDVFKNGIGSTDGHSTNFDQIQISNDFDNNSIASEPAYLLNDNNQFCHNCRTNLTSTDDLTSNLWMHYGELHTLSRFHSFKHVSRNISNLRHPDGASNPNLQLESYREPGNGAEDCKEKGQGSDEGDIDEVPYPPPLQSELLSLSRDTLDSKNRVQSVLNSFTYSGRLNQNFITNGYNNGITNGLTNGITNSLTNGITNGLTNGVTNGLTNGITNGKSHDPGGNGKQRNSEQNSWNGGRTRFEDIKQLKEFNVTSNKLFNQRWFQDKKNPRSKNLNETGKSNNISATQNGSRCDS